MATEDLQEQQEGKSLQGKVENERPSSGGGAAGSALKWLSLGAGMVLALALGVWLGIALGNKFAASPGQEALPATTAVVSPSPVAVRPSATAAATPTFTSLPPTATATATAAATATSAFTPTPTEAFANFRKACFAVLAEGDSFYGVMGRFGLGGGRVAFIDLYHYPFVVYGYAFEASKKPVKWANLVHLKLPDSKDEAKWDDLEKKLAVLPAGVGILVPGVGKDDCFANGGDWVPVDGFPEWVWGGAASTPTATPSGGG